MPQTLKKVGSILVSACASVRSKKKIKLGFEISYMDSSSKIAYPYFFLV